MRRHLKPIVQMRHEIRKEALSDISDCSQTPDEPSYALPKSKSCSRMRKLEITAPQNCVVKLVPSPLSEDKFVLRFASALTAFEVEVKVNETVEINWQEKNQIFSENSLSFFKRRNEENEEVVSIRKT